MECPACGHEFLPGQDFCDACQHDLTQVSIPQPREGRLHDLILEDPLSQLNAPPPLTLPLTGTVADAVAVMKRRRYGSVLVVAESGKLAGILTERDVVRKVSGRGAALDGICLEEVMTANPQTLHEDDTIAQALNCMAVGGYRHVPIVRDERPVGFVSIRGILQYIAKNAL